MDFYYNETDGGVWVFNDNAGLYEHLQNPDVANSLGIDWNAMIVVDSPPQPSGGDWGTDAAPPAAAAPSAAAPYPYNQNDDLIDPNGIGYRWYGDFTTGFWRAFPDGITASAMNFNYGGADHIDGPPYPLGDAWPSLDATYVAALPPAQLTSEYGQGGGTGGNDVGQLPPAGGGNTPATTPPINATPPPPQPPAFDINEDFGNQVQVGAYTFGTLIEIPSNGAFTLPDNIAGNVSVTTAWHNLINLLSGIASSRIGSVRSTARGFVNSAS